MSAVATASALLGVYRPQGPVFVAGAGCRLLGEDGRSYLDFASGIGVNALGHAHPAVVAAVQAGLETGLVHASNLFRTRPAEQLAAELVQHSFADKVFFCNSGAEANEAAFKFARRRARELGGPAKHEIVALTGSFHGRLFGALAATDRPDYRAPFEPLMPGVRFVAAGDEAAARSAIVAERTAAVIVEPIQGEGGVQPLEASYLRALRALCDDAGAALIFDEVQCGLGRTGRLFAYEEVGVAPDLLTLAKPLAAGLPMGAVLLGAAVAGAVRPGDHATTFGGGPLVSTVALAVVRQVAEPGFLAEVRSRGDQLAAALGRIERLPGVKQVRGRGLMWGIELDRPAAPVVAAALDAGLLVITAGPQVIRLLPPLVIEPADVAEGVDVLAAVLS